ncbi:Dicarboxylic amino acid permease [Wickerhamomyces ciferrii]|uniref:Dicarboxylic amino acid permease n=1 Tax=Wickerhamomyces ciferrii (strain ATCC 14091 / BCRC 22168 / CBS 111 / JCM 3599 / NBRC 0793 / NRRL Y-1031 F-60-10) TaxID=1206466 RepID=K0K8H5_WICCF|nr:Dicarboxylic amino acid permease [Wickerhamomyces ciferrii]CCH41145.1 Dicarboxylic amino acid permease [Wickerhamomyces ciferrii]
MNTINEKSSTLVFNTDIEKSTLEDGLYIQELGDYGTGELEKLKDEVGIKEGNRLKKHLQARHISMIAIGGAIGTGLLIGSGSALSSSGPAPLFIGYTFVGLIVYQVMCCLGEIATYIPSPSGFNGYAERYVDPALGFAVGWCYLIKYLIGTPNQITAGALVIQYWIKRDTVNPGVWITIITILILLVNIFGVKIFGEFEFWLSSIKIFILLGLLILMFIIMLGGGPTHDRLGFRYWNEPGAFKTFKGIGGEDKAKFVSFVNVLVTAVFAYSGTELIGVTVAEASNPRKSVPKAIRLTFYRIVVFYIIGVILLGMCVPYNDPLLIDASKASTSANASPFVVAIKNASIGKLDHVINACLLIFIFSAANSDLYIASRTLYGLACNGNAPKIFAKTSKYGIPFYSLGICTIFCFLGFMSISESSQQVFGYLVNVSSVFGLLTWMSILITHIGFSKALKAQGISKSSLAYSAPFHPYGTYIALFWCIVVMFIKNFTAFINGFNYKSFITGYIGIPVYLIAYLGYKFMKRTKIHRPEQVDLYTLKNIIDEEEEAGKIEEAERQERLKSGKKDKDWFYDKFVAWLF